MLCPILASSLPWLDDGRSQGFKDESDTGEWRFYLVIALCALHAGQIGATHLRSQ